MMNLRLFPLLGLLGVAALNISGTQKIEPVQYGNGVLYSKNLCGKRVASGDRLNCNGLTGAHRTLPFGSQIRVTNLKADKSVIVTINDRGPYSKKDIIDLSPAAAQAIGLTMRNGRVPVRIDVLIY